MQTQPTQKIRAVVFDLDDTLFAERDYVLSGYRAVAKFLRENSGRAKNFENWLWERFLAGRSKNSFDAMNEHFNLGLDKAGICKLVEVYRNHMPQIQAMPGMVQLLGLLRENYKLGLLSDGFLPAQQLKLQALGIERFFDEVVFTESLGRKFWKPSPSGFELLAKRLDVPHSACAYIADNVGKDFIAPNKLGWRTIRFVFPGQVYADKITITNNSAESAASTTAGADAENPENVDPLAQPQMLAKSPQEIRDAIRI